MNIECRGETVNIATGGVEVDRDLPPVVLLHGAGMDRTVWSQQTRYLAHHGFAAMAVDLPGHGESGGEPLPSIAEMADWVAEAITEIGLGPAHLVGHSMGSLISLEVAARHPEAVERIVLLGAAAAMPVHPDLLGAAERNEVLAPQLITSWGHGTRAHIAGNPTPGLWMRSGCQALLERANDGVIFNDLAACNAYEAGDVAARIACPITVVVGSEDKMTPPRATSQLVAGLSDVDLKHLDGVGHMMMIEVPDRIRELLLDALH
ncbi:MAG: alpha/beta hydrolase [Actinomycetota bacterium]|uniref:AB hydrolase-1 domain-containing protein n=1 Tax=marine metagenome TaxID=408172 RepID=A0A381PPN1_9ZZZZ|nr:alpha/beta hydrolase [Actinomycetota bacterium]MEE3187694.1 alpha/beta hydrolase [Actinomycetota bacterium]|tara:strand:- start:110 stop:898 length:789 start_codon:yes stop_codon:yes gene_type:complete